MMGATAMGMSISTDDDADEKVTVERIDKDADDSDKEHDDAGDGDEGGEDDYTPPTREEWERTRDALRKANDEAKKNRLKLRDAKKTADGDDAEAKAAEKWKPRVVRSQARAALLTAKGKNPERLLKLVDMDELDVDDDGEVIGLDAEVDRLREEFPELFETRAVKGKVRTGARGDGGAGGAKSATELQAKQLLGGR